MLRRVRNCRFIIIIIIIIIINVFSSFTILSRLLTDSFLENYGIQSRPSYAYLYHSFLNPLSNARLRSVDVF